MRALVASPVAIASMIRSCDSAIPAQVGMLALNVDEGLHLDVQAFPVFQQGAVAGRLDDGAVEYQVVLGEGDVILRLGGLEHVVAQVLEPCADRGGVLGDLLGRIAFQLRAHVVDLAQFLVVYQAHAGAAIADDLDEAERLEFLQGLAHRRLAGLHFRGDLQFLQPLSRRQLARDDLVEKVVPDLFRQGGPAEFYG